MYMEKLKIKGGYGEHGRNCFMLEYRPRHYLMADCGVMDSDSHPEPYLTREEAGQTDVLLLTHMHRDHAGAVPYLLNKGFRGWVIGSRDTIRMLRLSYDKVYSLDDMYPGRFSVPGAELLYGRSGHCPGSLWFLAESDSTSVFFSGDYQADSLLYACDVPHGLKADLAVIDMANDECDEDAPSLRARLCDRVKMLVRQGRKAVLPVQSFGRGPEILFSLSLALPECGIALDQRLINAMEVMLESTSWIRAENRISFLEAYEKAVRMTTELADIVLVADPHLDRAESRELVKCLLAENGSVVLTGRRRKGSFAAELAEQGDASVLQFPHHSSRTDAGILAGNNSFRVVLPFHTETREIWY